MTEHNIEGFDKCRAIANSAAQREREEISEWLRSMNRFALADELGNK
jgi:hypothetical protein